MFKWLKKQRDYMRKTAGLTEKNESIKRKIDVASKILERRTHEEPVDIERRTHRMIMSEIQLAKR